MKLAMLRASRCVMSSRAVESLASVKARKAGAILVRCSDNEDQGSVEKCRRVCSGRKLLFRGSVDNVEEQSDARYLPHIIAHVKGNYVVC